MIRYVITSHAHLSGVRLSRRGSFANMPHADEAAARAAAEKDAAGAAYVLTTAAYPALPALGRALQPAE